MDRDLIVIGGGSAGLVAAQVAAYVGAAHRAALELRRETATGPRARRAVRHLVGLVSRVT